MPFCPSCGAEVGGAFCAKCGSAVAGAAPSGGAASPPPAPPQGAYPPQGAGYPPQAAYPPQPASAPLADDLVSALCYVPLLITGVIFLVLEPYNKKPNIRFHAFQSIFLGAALFAFMIVLSIFTWIVSSVMGVFTLGLWPILLVVRLVIFLLWLYLVVQVYQGKNVVLPIIGPLAQKQAGM